MMTALTKLRKLNCFRRLFFKRFRAFSVGSQLQMAILTFKLPVEASTSPWLRHNLLYIKFTIISTHKIMQILTEEYESRKLIGLILVVCNTSVYNIFFNFFSGFGNCYSTFCSFTEFGR